MKIFALNLCLEFEVNDPSRTYDFEPITFADLMGYLFKGLEFEKQRFYVLAENTESFMDHVFDLQTNDIWRNLELTVCFRFSKQSAYDSFIEDFVDRFNRVDAAGGLVVNEKNEFLCIYNRQRWTLPKGGVEWREEIVDAAIREVKEETGLAKVQIQGKIGETYHTFRRGRRWVLKTTHWFKMFASSEEAISPQTEESIEAVAWMTKDQWINSASDTTFPLIRHLFEMAFSQSLIA